MKEQQALLENTLIYIKNNTSDDFFKDLLNSSHSLIRIKIQNDDESNDEEEEI